MKKLQTLPRPELEEIREEIRREKYRARYRRVLRSTAAVLIVVAAVSVLVATLWMPVLHIYGHSMSPTLNDGEIVLSVNSQNLRQGELVAFYYGNKLLIKRCIAGPGDWVNIDDDGNIYVNSEYLDEPYIQQKALGECNIKLPYQVPDERWFLVGDSRAVSIDSRSTQVGCIAQEQVVGRIVFRIWPLSGFGAVK